MAPPWLDAAAARRRRVRLLAVALAVLLAHGLLVERLAGQLGAERAARDVPPRLKVAFVRELQLSEPTPLAPAAPVVAPPPARRPTARLQASPGAGRAAASAPAASAPADSAASPPADSAAARAAAAAAAAEEREARLARARAAVAAALAADAAARAAQTASTAASTAAAVASQPQAGVVPPMPVPGAGVAAPGASPPSPGAAVGAAAAPGTAPDGGRAQAAPSGPAVDPAAPAGAAAFEWPPSTRLSYGLVGFVRGIVEGSARVDWLREGDHYQVHLDVLVGPSFAPLVQRRMSSDGTITAEGLAPRRYDEQTDVAFARGRSVSMAFDDAGITLGDGRRAERLPGVQDTASQFVQMTYLFRVGARRLETGAQIEMPLALPKRVDRWIYDVIGEEALATPFGTVPAWHLKPRRIGDPSTLTVEAWFAPRLGYLPVRIVIRQGDDNYIDLMIDRLPQQALPEAATAASAPAAPAPR